MGFVLFVNGVGECGSQGVCVCRIFLWTRNQRRLSLSILLGVLVDIVGKNCKTKEDENRLLVMHCCRSVYDSYNAVKNLNKARKLQRTDYLAIRLPALSLVLIQRKFCAARHPPSGLMIGR